jgi:UDP-GlcNAc:undecaprenyl-phosphate GlcNAc-1-phosphate transferase
VRVIQAAVLEALVTFLAMVSLVLVLRPLAARVGLVARPDQIRRHGVATPAVGGLGILLAVAGCLVASRFAALASDVTSYQMRGVALAALIIVAGGMIDDRFRLQWPYRLGVQVLAALVLIHVGGIRVQNLGYVFGFHLGSLGRWSELLTIVATVGIINAINMIDGVDGLAGSVSLVVVVMLTSVAIYAGNRLLAMDLGFVAGALCGFLAFNLRTPWNRTASIFLGNAGADLLGLLIASACFRLTQNIHHPVGPQLAPFLLAPALIDCLTLMLRRLRSGRSPFEGDRNHLHHLLLDAGLTPSAVVVVLTGGTIAIGMTAMLAMKAHVAPLAFTLVFIMVWLGYFRATWRRDMLVGRLRALAESLGLAQAPVEPS